MLENMLILTGSHKGTNRYHLLGKRIFAKAFRMLANKQIYELGKCDSHIFACTKKKEEKWQIVKYWKNDIVFFDDLRLRNIVVWCIFPTVFGNISFELISCSMFALRRSVALAFLRLLIIYLFILLFIHTIYIPFFCVIGFGIAFGIRKQFVCANWNSMDCGQFNGLVRQPSLSFLPIPSLSLFFSLLTAITMQNWQCLPAAYKIANMSTF